jgi:hypothetical protein
LPGCRDRKVKRDSIGKELGAAQRTTLLMMRSAIAVHPGLLSKPIRTLLQLKVLIGPLSRKEEISVQQALREQLALRVLRVRKAPLDLQVRLEPQAHRDPREYKDQPGLREQQGLQEQMEQRGPQVHKDQLGPREGPGRYRSMPSRHPGHGRGQPHATASSCSSSAAAARAGPRWALPEVRAAAAAADMLKS